MPAPGLTGRVIGWLEAAAALLLFLLMLIVLVDVVLRSGLNRPLPWGTELLEVVLGTMIFLLYPALALRDGHITVDLIAVRPALKRVQRVLAGTVGTTLFALIAWCLGRQSLRAAEFGEGTPLLHIPYAAMFGTMAVLAALAAMAFAVTAWRAVRRAAPAAVPLGPTAAVEVA